MFSGDEYVRRLEAYIENVRQALDNLRVVERDGKVLKLVELARAYLDDSLYYFNRRDYFTSLSCIAYAEGILDTLNRLGYVELEWRSLSSLLDRPRVLVAGTFEIIHPGHIELFKRAWEKGRVYVIVSRDSNAEKFKKRPIIVPEEQRRRVVESLKYVYKAVLGDREDMLKPVEEIKPDVILLGPDQGVSEDWLRKELEKRGVKARIERLKEKVECSLCSTSKIINAIIEKIGKRKRS